jgi:hypothetical protein
VNERGEKGVRATDQPQPPAWTRSTRRLDRPKIDAGYKPEDHGPLDGFLVWQGQEEHRMSGDTTGADCAELCERWRLHHTFAPVGRPTGNAVVERFIRTLEEELTWPKDWDNAEQLRVAIEAWTVHYMAKRPHQALDWQTPAERRADRLGLPLARAA